MVIFCDNIQINSGRHNVQKAIYKNIYFIGKLSFLRNIFTFTQLNALTTFKLIAVTVYVFSVCILTVITHNYMLYLCVYDK